MDNEILNHKPITIKNGLPTKKFEPRNSILTDLLENVHNRIMYNIPWVIVITSQLRYVLHNYFTYGRFGFNVELFKISFSKPLPLLSIWVCIFLASFLPYIGFVLWATIRHQISKLNVPFFDRLSLIIYISYMAIYTYNFAVIIHQNDFEPASGVALLLELVRLKMKCYAFIRSNVPRAMNFKYHDKNGILYPNLSKYLYFLFIPTLIYQDDHPRSKSIRWKKVAEHLANFAGTFLLVNIILEHCVTQFEIFSRTPCTWTNFLVIVVEFAPLSGMIMLCLFYSFFHCWSNAFAEMLRFSDRCFYKDFWRSTSMERYFRTWSGIVYDWLYVYVYKDFYEIVWPNNKFVARSMVFFVSAFFHEFILGFTFKTFAPYTFIIQFFGSFILKLISFDYAMGNFIFLLSIAIGSSILTCGYGTQYYYNKIK